MWSDGALLTAGVGSPGDTVMVPGELRSAVNKVSPWDSNGSGDRTGTLPGHVE